MHDFVSINLELTVVCGLLLSCESFENDNPSGLYKWRRKTAGFKKG